MFPFLMFPFLSFLLRAGEGAIPLRVSVQVDDEVAALRAQVAELTAELERLQQEYNRTEYHYRCESLINTKLVDLCRDNGIKIEPFFSAALLENITGMS